MIRKNIKPNMVREKILKAAVSLLGECGIKKLAQPQIAKKAGVPQGHMTYYFPTRSDLLLAVAERSLASIANKISKSSSKQTLSPVELVLPLIKDKSRTRMLIGLLVESDENKILKDKLQQQTEIAKALIAIVSGRSSDSAEVLLTHATIIGLGIQNYLGSESVDFEKQINQALELLIKQSQGDHT
jgi:AcrR family transcriptional regulator